MTRPPTPEAMLEDIWTFRFPDSSEELTKDWQAVLFGQKIWHKLGVYPQPRTLDSIYTKYSKKIATNSFEMAYLWILISFGPNLYNREFCEEFVIRNAERFANGAMPTANEAVRASIGRTLKLPSHHEVLDMFMHLGNIDGNIGEFLYRVNCKLAMASVNWLRAQRHKDVLPYLLTIQPRGSAPCPCGLPSGLILPVDHEFWKIAFPPNRPDCQCNFRSISAREIRRKGWHVVSNNDLPDLSGIPSGYRMNAGLVFSTDWLPALI